MFYAMKDASPMVKNYAKQSNAVLALEIVSMVAGIIPLVGLCVSPLVFLVSFAAWVMLLIKALSEVADYKLPAIGDFFDTLLK